MKRKKLLFYRFQAIITALVLFVGVFFCPFKVFASSYGDKEEFVFTTGSTVLLSESYGSSNTSTKVTNVSDSRDLNFSRSGFWVTEHTYRFNVYYGGYTKELYSSNNLFDSDSWFFSVSSPSLSIDGRDISLGTFTSFDWVCTSDAPRFLFNYTYSATAIWAVNSAPNLYRSALIKYTFSFPSVIVEDVTPRTEKDILESIEKGYENGDMGSSSDSLDSSLSDFSSTEDSIFTSAKEGADAFEMESLENPNLIASMSFTSNLLQAIWIQAGGVSGFGLIGAVAFTFTFCAVIVGLYRYYKGGKGG